MSMEAPLATGAGVAAAADGPAQPEQHAWEASCARVRDVAARLQSRDLLVTERQFELLVEELLALADAGDALVAFLAVQTLHDAFARISTPEAVSAWARRILQCSTSSDPTARFQLIRRFVRGLHDKSDIEGDRSDGSDGDEDDDSGEDETGENDSPWYLSGVLQNLPLFEILLNTAFENPDGHYHVAHEAIVCLTDIVKRASSAESRCELCDVVQRTVDRALPWQFGGNDGLPIFLACDIVDLVVHSRTLDRHTKGTGSGSAWVEMATATLKSPLSRLAMQLLLDQPVASDDACADSFVSMISGYPFMQKWIHLCCVTASNLLSLTATEHPVDTITALNDLQLPRRARLLSVLTEQDDVLIDVLIELLAIDRCLNTTGVTHVSTKISLYFQNELLPAFVFADLLHLFSDDHLVVLDMLMSSETRMLEYLLQYLRHATTSWPQTHQAWTQIDRVDSVMAVLIRLRLELERQVATGVFPYNPAPLLRRLEALERLYESE